MQKLKFPTFSGDIRDYKQFKELFIHFTKHLDQTECLYQLVESMQRPAERKKVKPCRPLPTSTELGKFLMNSTETALLKIVNDLLLFLDDGKCSLLASLDLSAAFDTIDHNILLHRLKHDFGLSGTVLDWFSSYLSGRIQSVCVHSHTSVPASVSCGVPQGSVLGPIFFVLCTTPLSTLIERHSILHYSYPDDTQLQNSATPDRLPNLIDSMRLCIDDIKDWMTDNKLKLNDDKTEVMIISSSRMSTALSIPESFDIGNGSVPFSDTVKNLGVTLDCHLSLKTHVLNLVRTANFELRRISCHSSSPNY